MYPSTIRAFADAPAFGRFAHVLTVGFRGLTTEAHVKIKNKKGARYDGAWGSRKIL